MVKGKDKANLKCIEEIEGFKPHKHLCQIYSTLEEWKTAVSSFLMTGLRQGEKCYYVVNTHTTNQVRALLHSQGVDLTTAEASGQLIILHETKAYTLGGYFDPDRMISSLVTLIETAIAEGYTAIRGAGEMSWVLRGRPGSNRFIEYEAKLNRDVYPNYPITGLCQYECQRFGLPLLLNVICTHPTIMIGTEVYDNPYYIPAAEFLNSKHSLVDLKRWMDKLAKLREIEEKEKQPRGKLDRSGRLVSIAELAAGVALEITSLITLIIGLPKRLLKKEPKRRSSGT